MRVAIGCDFTALLRCASVSARRFSLVPLVFLALWALWFLLPPTREVAQSQWKARLLTSPTIAPYASSAFASDTSRDAAFIRALDADRSGANRRRSLQQVGQRFPDDAAICAAQIVASVDELRLYNTRHPGPSSSADLNWSVKLNTKPIETPSPELLKSWFAATARGAKLEPNNTFWDWAQIIGLLAARRDDEVWGVLRVASQKTGYDDHVNDGALARLRVARQRQLMSPLSQISIGAATLFPHYAPMREAARQVSDNASGLRIRGGAANQKQALEGMRDFAGLGRTMRRESKSTIGSLVGTAVEAIALYGGSYFPTRYTSVKRPRIGTSVAIYGSEPRSLLFFARQMGRNDIAAQLGSEWTEIGAWRAKTNKAISSSGLLSGLSTRDVVVAEAGNWLSFLTLAGMPTLLVVAVGCSLLLRFVPAWRRESEAMPSLLSWGWGALLSLAALIALSSTALLVLWSAWRIGGATTIDLLFGSFSGASTFSPSPFSAVAPISWQYHFPAALGLFAALWLASLWETRRQGRPTLGARLRRLFHAPDDGVAHFDLSPLLALTGTVGAFFLISFGVIGFLVVSSSGEQFKFLSDYAGFFLLGFVVLWTVPYLSRLRTAQSRAFALILMRRFAWSQLIFLTVLWGMLWLATKPAQRRFDAAFTRQLQVGEFQLIRKQVGV